MTEFIKELLNKVFLKCDDMNCKFTYGKLESFLSELNSFLKEMGYNIRVVKEV